MNGMTPSQYREAASVVAEILTGVALARTRPDAEVERTVAAVLTHCRPHIETIHQLRDVPGCSVIADSGGIIWQSVPHATDMWWRPGEECPSGIDEITFPVVLIWTGGQS